MITYQNNNFIKTEKKIPIFLPKRAGLNIAQIKGVMLLWQNNSRKRR